MSIPKPSLVGKTWIEAVNTDCLYTGVFVVGKKPDGKQTMLLTGELALPFATKGQPNPDKVVKAGDVFKVLGHDENDRATAVFEVKADELSPIEA